jgi:hypothetical protein
MRTAFDWKHSKIHDFQLVHHIHTDMRSPYPHIHFKVPSDAYRTREERVSVVKLLQGLFFLISHFICILYQYIQQML